jgi:hypothetical protein
LVTNCMQQIAMAAQSKAQKVFARPNTGIVGSNPTRGMFVFILCLPHVKAGENTSTVIPASCNRRQKGDAVVSGETASRPKRRLMRTYH